ncbi:MAG TPA: CcoQ/FixQ family Cbb3-type cytochrome c oxidase assembly chaperone [Rudaea sp.]|nr:CcoQ/FixQ family Cbb3-type cytochrome c oxidase assembly chaperone [Rudaea sp.]
MNPIWGPIAGGFIIAMMLAFIGIWVWAWMPWHKRTFNALARLPMEDENAEDEDDAAIATEDKP